MNARNSMALCAALALMGAHNGYGESPAITRFSVESTNAALDWSATTDRYIVATSDNLSTGQFEFVGPVLSTNHAAVTCVGAPAFYRVREVFVVDLPASLRGLITDAILKKYDPPGNIYDIDLPSILALNANGAGLSNASCLVWCSGLTNLSISTNQLHTLDLSRCANLGKLDCSVNQLTNLELSGSVTLSILDCSSNRLAALNVSGFPNLTELYCQFNFIQSLDVSSCPNLKYLFCFGNELTNLNTAGLAHLESLACVNNPLRTLDVTGDVSMRFLYCYSTLLTNLNLAGCTNLSEVNCSYNQLSDLSSFVSNAAVGGLGTGDTLHLESNPLSPYALTNQIPYLTNLGVVVYY